MNDIPPEADFDLVDEPWLPCLLEDGSVEELSLRRALVEARRVREVSLEVATQFPPVLRMMLAVVHRALGQAGTSGGPREEASWRHLWALGSLPAAPVNRYLDDYRGRFQLFDPAAPFLQAAGLEAASGETKTVAQLIPYAASGNNTPLFSAARDDDPPSLTCAEAARWLLHVHAWDTAAIKTGAARDPVAKNGKTTGNPTGPLGQLGVVIPAGPTLWHTLLLNLLVLGDDLSPPGDQPCWEGEPLTAQWDPSRRPRGVLDLYTWAGRRVRLLPERTAGGVRVRRVVVTAGDRIADVSALAATEPHTAWRRSENQEKKLKRAPVYMPRRHQPGRELWRGLGPILAKAHAGRPGQDRGPMVLGPLAARASLLADCPIRLIGAGITYGNQSAVIEETYADVMPLPVALLSDQDQDWEAAALEAVRGADDTGTALANLSVNLSRAAGCDNDRILDGRRRAARSRLFAELDPRFRTWVAGLGDGGEQPAAALARWRAEVASVAGQIATEAIGAAPPQALRGRETQRGTGGRAGVLTAPLAEIWFRAALRKALPPAAGDKAGGPAVEKERTA